MISSRTSTSPKASYFAERVAQNTYNEVKRDQKRGCGQCRWCKSNHPFGCPHVADQSQIDAVMASVVEETRMAEQKKETCHLCGFPSEPHEQRLHSHCMNDENIRADQVGADWNPPQAA